MNWVRKVHKWASVLVGVQFLIWLGSGMYFNFMDHMKAAGHTYKNHLHTSTMWSNLALVEPKTILQQQPASTSVELISLNDKPYYLLNHQRGLYPNFENKHSLVNALDGNAVAMNQDMAKMLALSSYSGPGQVLSATLLQPPLDDFPKQKNAAWQVNFSDDIQTSVYIEADTGRVVGHSDSDKRLADFFLMLHFMDYANEGSFNNIQMIVFAFFTLWLSITGLIWSIDLGLRGQYKLNLFGRKKTVKLFDAHQRSLGQISFSTHCNLLDGLVSQNIVLPSTCGGGGTCGRCKIMINPVVKTTSADELHFSSTELAQGYRLACQHFCDDVEHMTLMDITDAKKYMLELTGSVFLSPFIKELRFKARSALPAHFKAGAFMRFFIPAADGMSIPLNLPEHYQPEWADKTDTPYSHGPCSRNYSIAGRDQSSNELVFVIKMQAASGADKVPGIGSNYLGNLAVGATIEAIGPFEEFHAKANSQNDMVLIGAGSGMAPLKALLEEQLAQMSSNNVTTRDKPSRTIHFFYGARTENDLIYVDYFYQLAKDHPNFFYYPVLSRGHDDWLGATGYAQHVLALNWKTMGPVNQLEFYLCGPKGLMDDTITYLHEQGVDSGAIAFDVFS
jgi:Na(+)-translocating NADH:ubiquinone oxidoreductase F subunit